MENKQRICNLLLEALQATTHGKPVTALRYTREDEHDPLSEEQVEIVYNNAWGKTVCVTADSGLAMIKDIMNAV